MYILQITIILCTTACLELALKRTILHTALFALTLPMSLYGMGLGEMKVESNLDQPFKAEVELIDVGNTPLTGIKVGIADPDNFEHVGIERAAVLSLLDFKIAKNEHGKVVINIQSKERMTEPYMQMVIDLAWSTGQIYKVYTILLDPPGYQLVNKTAEGGASYYKEASAYKTEPGVVKQEVISHVVHNKLPTHIDDKKSSTYGPTITNENVWQIAQRYKTSDVMLPQVVLAIVGANPDAFKEGNLNGLNVGVRLKIPSTSEIQQVPADLATQEVMAHDKAWNDKIPINHVISPPYMSAEKSYKTPAVYHSELPGIPKMENLEEQLPVGKTTLINPNITVPLENNKQSKQFKLPHSPEEEATTRAEISITTAAVDSMRSSNALLSEQFLALQEQNKKLQEQLNKSTKDMDFIRSQLQLMIKERKAAASQASGSIVTTQSSSIWPLFLLLIIIGGGGGLAYWYFIKRKQEGEEPSPMGPTPSDVKPFVPKEQSVQQPEEQTQASVSILPLESEEIIPEQIKVEKPVEDNHFVSVEKQPIEEAQKIIPEMEMNGPTAVEAVNPMGSKLEPSVAAPDQESSMIELEPTKKDQPLNEIKHAQPLSEKHHSIQKDEEVSQETKEKEQSEQHELLEFEPTEKDQIPMDTAVQTLAEIKQTLAISEEYPLTQKDEIREETKEKEPSEQHELLEFEPTEKVQSPTETALKTPVEIDQTLPLIQENSSIQKVEGISEDTQEKEQDDNNKLLEFEPGLHEKLTERSAQIEQSVKEKEDKNDLGLEFDVETVLESKKYITKESKKKEEVKKVEDLNLDEFFSEYEIEEQADGQLEEDPQTIKVTEESRKPEPLMTDQFVGSHKEIIEEDQGGQQQDEKEVEEATGVEDDEQHTANPLKSKRALDTLLALARTYVSMDDFESAKQSLEEVVEHGSEEQKEHAKLMLEEIKGK